MKFISEMWHPNGMDAWDPLYALVYPTGDVCISILHSPGVDIMNSQVCLFCVQEESLGIGRGALETHHQCWGHSSLSPVHAWPSKYGFSSQCWSISTNLSPIPSYSPLGAMENKQAPIQAQGSSNCREISRNFINLFDCVSFHNKTTTLDEREGSRVRWKEK